jgi:Phosphatidylinositol 3- and 4-kinase/Phosphoinositide 3-kinase family, accessory domain (PIK domain)/Phosphoinositide 3-kinase C2/Phorbol esters/diacylglycerol binding domain (C1 domain)
MRSEGFMASSRSTSALDYVASSSSLSSSSSSSDLDALRATKSARAMAKLVIVCGHHFEAKTFSKMSRCDYCAKVLWGLSGRGYSCQLCKMALHGKCLPLLDAAAEQCAGKATASSSSSDASSGKGKKRRRRRHRGNGDGSGSPSSSAIAVQSAARTQSSAWNWSRCKQVKHRVVVVDEYLAKRGSQNENVVAGSSAASREVASAGRLVKQAAKARNIEEAYYRVKMARLIELYRQRYPDSTDTPALAHVCSGAVPPELVDANLQIRFYFSTDRSTVLLIPEVCSVREALHMACDKIAKKWQRSGPNSEPPRADELVVKLAGRAVYINDVGVRLGSLAYVRQCFSRLEKIEFVLLPAHSVRHMPTLEKLHQMNATTRQLLSLTDDKLELPVETIDAYTIRTIAHPFELGVIAAQNLDLRPVLESTFNKSSIDIGQARFFVEVALVFGGELLGPPFATNAQSLPRWGEWIRAATPLCHVPLESRLCITLYASYQDSQSSSSGGGAGGSGAVSSSSSLLTPTASGASDAASDSNVQPIGWVNFNLAAHDRTLRQGVFDLPLWTSGPANPIGTCVTNIHGGAVVLHIEINSSPLPIIFPYDNDDDDHESPSVQPTVESGGGDDDDDDDDDGAAKLKRAQTMATPKVAASIVARREARLDRSASEQLIGSETMPSSEEVAALRVALGRDSLCPLSVREKMLLWRFRHWCMATMPLSLARVLQSAHWDESSVVESVHWLVRAWPRIDPMHALELLGAHFADAEVRSFAVRCLATYSDNDLAQVLLQLVQALKYEATHSSPLAHFLTLRAVRSQPLGHMLYWHFEAELHSGECHARFKLLKKALLCSMPSERRGALLKQGSLARGLAAIATRIKQISDKSARRPALQEQLRAASLPDDCGLPIDACVRTRGGAIVERCKVMQSFTVPLWLVFRNDDPLGAPVQVIFKVGDDLRQDTLTLQLIAVMDELWQREGLDLHMLPYKCVSTGDSVGMIEVVLNSATMADVHKEHGGGAFGALKEKVLASWLREHNPSDDQYERAVHVFALSLAGYCVATFVLGIGDRHNDNVMITKQGNVFHIDFAHFLGNTLKFAGIDRETSPFILTPELVYVLGGARSERFEHFTATACRAFLIVRRHANVFITLFSLMLSTGIPQLTQVDDIGYLRDALRLAESEEQAQDYFLRQIEKARHNKRARFNNLVHVLANPD